MTLEQKLEASRPLGPSCDIFVFLRLIGMGKGVAITEKPDFSRLGTFFKVILSEKLQTDI